MPKKTIIYIFEVTRKNIHLKKLKISTTKKKERNPSLDPIAQKLSFWICISEEYSSHYRTLNELKLPPNNAADRKYFWHLPWYLMLVSGVSGQI